MSNETKKKERHSPFRIIGNMLFLFRYLFKYTPSTMLWGFLNAVLNAGQTIIRNVIFVKIIFDAVAINVNYYDENGSYVSGYQDSVPMEGKTFDPGACRGTGAASCGAVLSYQPHLVAVYSAYQSQAA